MHQNSYSGYHLGSYPPPCSSPPKDGKCRSGSGQLMSSQRLPWEKNSWPHFRSSAYFRKPLLIKTNWRYSGWPNASETLVQCLPVASTYGTTILAYRLGGIIPVLLRALCSNIDEWQHAILINETERRGHRTTTIPSTGAVLNKKLKTFRSLN